MDKNKQQVKEEIKNLLSKAESALYEAEQLAIAEGVNFYWSGPTYGMGGSFSVEDEDWQASSESC